MIVYWAWPTAGRGHATRAAAICRRLSDPVVVIRGTADPILNQPLEYFGIPFNVKPDRERAVREVLDLLGPQDTLVVDDGMSRELDWRADVYIWRLGRRPHRKMVSVEPGGKFPVTMLDGDEVLSRAAAREALGWPDGVGERFARVLSIVNPDLDAEMGPVIDLFPVSKYLRATGMIVGSCGLNLFSEVALVGMPAVWKAAKASPDQRMRVDAWSGVAGPFQNAAPQLADLISQARAEP